MRPKIEKFVQYGVSNELAEKAARLKLTVTKVKTLSKQDMVERFGLFKNEADILVAAVRREPIDRQVLQTLLERSNFACNVCKGVKSTAFIVHHLEEYSKSQDNGYCNLIVLCPNDHDLAHRSGGLTLSIEKEDLVRCKEKWEHQVEVANAARAARQIDISEEAIDFVNIRRLEALCLQIFGEIPRTPYSSRLQSKKILDKTRSFNQKYVEDNLSGKAYLFDYTNQGEALHYAALLRLAAAHMDFIDLGALVQKGFNDLKLVEGRHAFFVGGVYCPRPDIPITSGSPAVRMHYKRRKVILEWMVTPMYMMSMSAISRLGTKNRYIIYCLIRSVERGPESFVTVKATPYLFAQPKAYVHKKPVIAYVREAEGEEEPDLSCEE